MVIPICCTMLRYIHHVFVVRRLCGHPYGSSKPVQQSPQLFSSLMSFLMALADGTQLSSFPFHRIPEQLRPFQYTFEHEEQSCHVLKDENFPFDDEYDGTGTSRIRLLTNEDVLLWRTGRVGTRVFGSKKRKDHFK